MNNNDNAFYGKYRGKVTDNQDPLMMGRIRANIPDIMSDQESGWAMPCVPFGGKGMGFLGLPTVGAGVWIEFEHGDPDYPIWTGSWWGSSSELPSELLDPPYQKVQIKTDGGHTIILDDTPGEGGITLQTADGMKIVMNATGIEINNGQGGKITLSGPQVSINDGALEVV